MSPLAAACGALVRGYQRWASPLLGARCRFLPSCSEYLAMAVEEWGALRGVWLGMRRLLRCHPLHRSGLDLPPQRTRTSGASETASARWSP